jgi:hypothetical protein
LPPARSNSTSPTVPPDPRSSGLRRRTGSTTSRESPPGAGIADPPQASAPATVSPDDVVDDRDRLAVKLPL